MQCDEWLIVNVSYYRLSYELSLNCVYTRRETVYALLPFAVSTTVPRLSAMNVDRKINNDSYVSDAAAVPPV